MRPKREICREIHKILKESEIPATHWEKVLMRIVNYTYNYAKVVKEEKKFNHQCKVQ